jgi:hypothetical protein
LLQGEDRVVTEVDNETWIVYAGDEVIVRKADRGYDSLSAVERLVYCLWVADYGMRNAGDLVAAFDVHWPFLEHGRIAATQLSLLRSMAAFSLSANELQRRYFELFDGICEEIRGAPGAPTGSPPAA